MNLLTMAPNAKHSLLLTVVFTLVAGGTYFGLVEPALSQYARLEQTRDDLRLRHVETLSNLARAGGTQARLAVCATNLAPYRAAMLEPLLESFAMRAKALVDPLALGAGLDETDYAELPVRALPVPKRLPEQLHARLPIRMTARGSFQSAVSFLLRLEREFPLVTLQAMTVQSQPDPKLQRISFVLEWPVRGKTTTTVSAKKKGGAR